MNSPNVYQAACSSNFVIGLFGDLQTAVIVFQCLVDIALVIVNRPDVIDAFGHRFFIPDPGTDLQTAVVIFNGFIEISQVQVDISDT
ncbi:hypothetical protein D3C86_1419960 [compost metagenome]